MKIEGRNGKPLEEATVVVGGEELIDLLQGLADVVEGKREHLHFRQPGGAELVVRLSDDYTPDPIGRQTDWFVGPLVLFGLVFVIVGMITVARWAIGLLS